MHAPLKDAAFYKLSKSILKIQSKLGKVALMTCCQALGAAITLRQTNTTHGQLRGMANYGAWPITGHGQVWGPDKHSASAIAFHASSSDI